MMDFKFDGLGFMLIFGDIVWVFFLYLMMCCYFFIYFVYFGFYGFVVVIVIFVIGVYIFCVSNV